MLRHSTVVTTDDTASFLSDIDPTAPGFGNHLSFDRILRRCGHAWTALLTDIGGFGENVIGARLEVDYTREVHAGTLDIDVTVLSVGRTSFRVRCDVSQDGHPAATVQVVLVCFSYVTQQACAMTDAQRAGLMIHALPD